MRIDRRDLAAAGWRLDVKGAEVRASLAAAGVPCLLLKGRAFATLLYADGSPRPYGDCDLLVPLSLADRAQAVLSDLRFTAHDSALHARNWYRTEDHLSIDLHHTLPLLAADPEHVWAALAVRATWLTVGGAPTRVLDPAAAAMLTALHLVHHGPDTPRAREDLQRAIDQLDADCWGSAAALAQALGGAPALGTGLRLLPAGVPIAERLGLAWAPSPRTVLIWQGAPWGATVWESLASAPDIRSRAALLADFVAPSPDFLRERSRLARHGLPGLLLTYLLRPFRLTAKALFSLRPWLRARRTPREPWAS